MLVIGILIMMSERDPDRDRDHSAIPSGTNCSRDLGVGDHIRQGIFAGHRTRGLHHILESPFLTTLLV